MPQAWDIETGRSSVRIGVVDTGIDGDHPDLINRVNTTHSEEYLLDDYNPLDDSNGHGTRVAGIIGAQGNNSKGIAGVAWNCNLVSLRASLSIQGSISDFTLAVQEAESKGISIINISAGSSSYNTNLYLAIQQFPGLVICGAGNNDLDIDNNPIYPAAYNLTNIISVGSCGSNDTKSSSSNFGRNSVDIFAPGENIYSTNKNGGYNTESGTSFAAPYVTGVAALILSECPNVTTAQIKYRILTYRDPVSSLGSRCVSGGRLNAYKAVSNAHSYQYTPKDARQHTATCACGKTTTQSHKFILIGAQYVCESCGYLTINP